jgi:hypothetical protein
MNRTRRAALAAVIVTATAGSFAGVATAMPAGIQSESAPDCVSCSSAAPQATQRAASGVGRWGSGTEMSEGPGWRAGAGPGSPAARGGGYGMGRGQGRWSQGTGQGQGGPSGDHADLPPAVAGAEITANVEDQLQYLVEEEKLAGDIYALAQSLYGDRVFSNIARSEDHHAEEVGVLLDRYDVTDPTAGRAAGTFADTSLQAIYNKLAAQVRTSREEAVQAGILIEETDIADLKELLTEGQLPADVTAVAENLLAGSQRHLAAFQRQS